MKGAKDIERIVQALCDAIESLTNEIQQLDPGFDTTGVRDYLDTARDCAKAE